MKRWTLLSLVLAVAVALTLVTAAAMAQEEAGGEEEPTFAQKFWNYLEKVDYRENWSPWPGTEGEFVEGKSPHGALLKVYVNDEATKNFDDPPPKSIIVKENFNEDKKLVAITPMYRIPKEYDPEHNNWFWAKYMPDGTVAEKDGMKLAGRVKGCIECHASAQGNDFMFMNDQGRE